MNRIWLLPFVFLFSCGGSLSDEQRKAMKEGMEQQRIVRVSEAEIMSEALKKGQRVVETLEKRGPDAGDSLRRTHKVKVRYIRPGEQNARQMEREVIDAYIEAIAFGNAQENLQKLWTSDQRQDYDSLLYSKPDLIMKPDGSDELRGIWNIYMARKDLVLDFQRKK